MRWFGAIVLLVSLMVAIPLQAQEQAPSQSSYELKEIEVSGPYCGIYALTACLSTFGIEPPMSELLIPECVGSIAGSSDSELIQAAEKYGCYGKTYSNMSWEDLKKSNSPMILHVRSSYADQRFNHWIVFLGVDGGYARIVDIPHPLATILPAELLASWDGTAIEISDRPITSDLMRSSLTQYLILVAMFLGSAVLIRCFWNRTQDAFATSAYIPSPYEIATATCRRCKRRPTDVSVVSYIFMWKGYTKRMKRGFVQTAGLLGTLFVMGILFHAVTETGFLRNPTAVAEVTRRYYSVNIPEITLAEMEEIVADQNISIFDARYIRDFQRGTIPGAKSLSISSILQERQKVLSGIPKTQRIVVFCQSDRCGYADEIAQFLKFNGFVDVVLYRGGYREWVQEHKLS